MNLASGSRKALGRLLGSCLPVAVAALQLACGDGGRPDRVLAIVGATIRPAPGAAAIPDGVVVVRGGKISAVGPREQVAIPVEAEVVEGAGGTLLAGFWNCHVHFTAGRLFAAGFLPGGFVGPTIRDMLTRYGFVHVVDTGSWGGSTIRLRERLASGDLSGPSLLVAGGSFVGPGGSPFYLDPIELPEIGTPDAARAGVREMLDAGADGIKLMIGGMATPDETVFMEVEVARAAVDEAHRAGAFVVAHPANSRGTRIALEAGVDILAHTFADEREGAWDRSLPGEMQAAGMALVPTLALWPIELRRAGLPEDVVLATLEVAQDQVRAHSAAGGEILFGTDVGYLEDHDPANEYRYLEASGLSFDQILETLTTAPAARFGVADRTGKIELGYDADFVLVEGDPASDPSRLARVRASFRRGEALFSAR